MTIPLDQAGRKQEMAYDTDWGQMWRSGGQGTPEPNPRSRVTRGLFVAAPGPSTLFVLSVKSIKIIRTNYKNTGNPD